MADKNIISVDGQPHPDGRAEEVLTIPLVEEQITISRREVESSRLRVHVHVDQRAEMLSEQLRRDDVEVERVARNVPLAGMPNVRLEGNTTIIPVVEEVVVVEKRLMLVEEIHIQRREEVEQREIPVTLRREWARIERSDTPSAAAGTSALPNGKHPL